MIRKRIVTDLETCRLLWKTFVTPRNVSDLWEFRFCFHRHYENPPHFIVLEDREGVCALLPICYLPDGDQFVLFPGEIWKGRTWLERTPVYLRASEFLFDLLSVCPERTYLRYLEVEGSALPAEMEQDEIGYLLYPPHLGFDISTYYQRFSWKKLKGIKKEIASFVIPHGSWHINRLPDYDRLVSMNVENFGPNSYFFDPRFAEGFRDALEFLHRNGLLRLASLEIQGETVAVDLAAQFQGSYVVFLGGTHPEYRGVAKAMNMYHIEYACEQKLERADFLCGDFHWKKLWHLDPEALYKYVSPDLKSEQPHPEELPRESELPGLSLPGLA